MKSKETCPGHAPIYSYVHTHTKIIYFRNHEKQEGKKAAEKKKNQKIGGKEERADLLVPRFGLYITQQCSESKRAPTDALHLLQPLLYFWRL